MRSLFASLCALAPVILLPALATTQAGPSAAPAVTPKTFRACYVQSTGAIYSIGAPGLPTACGTTHKAPDIELSWTDGANAIRTGTDAAGDLGGTFPNPTVLQLLGRKINSTAPTDGQVYVWSQATNQWVARTLSGGGGGTTDHGALTGLTDDDHPQYLLTSGTRALTGNLALGGNRITGLAAATSNGDAVRYEQAVKSGDAAGGDLSGTLPSPTVARLQGRAMSNAAPTNGQVLTWDNTNSLWKPMTSPTGVTDHGALTGLSDDDHPIYLLATGTRALSGNLALGGNRITGLAAATTNGDAVRYEQAVKSGDTAGGDLSGTLPSPTVAKLQGRAVASTAPTDGQVLTWDNAGSTWKPGTSATGVTDHGALTGLSDDDHPIYLLATGTRALSGNLALGGNRITGLAAATMNGDAVRYEQAVKVGDSSGGDASGVFSSLTVTGLRGRSVASTAPTDGQVLAWDNASSAWKPATVSGGGGGTSDHGALTGLSDDDHTQYLLANGSRSTTNGFAVTGAFDTGTLPVTGEGTRMLWFPGQGAFRVGNVNGPGSDYWDQVNLGRYSFATGENTRATGDHAFAAGSGTTASGAQSVALGINSSASATGTFSFNGTASADDAIAIGSQAQATAEAAMALGLAAFAAGTGAVAIGPGANASAPFSVSLGYGSRAAGSNSVAIGKGARAIKQGSIVLADGCTGGLLNDEVSATANNQFVVRGCGGIRFYTNVNLSAGVDLAPGGGSWSTMSDRNRKENFSEVDGEALLKRLAEVPVSTWNYKAQETSIRHMGAMAQDFAAAFGLGESNLLISTIDMDGVTLAGVQALEHRTTEQAARIAELEKQNAELAERLTRLEAALGRVTGAGIP